MPHRHHSQHHHHRPDPLLARAPPERLKPPLHRLEKALLLVVAAHLVFLPWALGAMHVWSQSVSFGFSVLGFGLALRTRTYSEEITGGEPFRLHMVPKLLRFPIFWLGLLFLLYILIQALNPAWEYVTDGKFWWLRSMDHVDWLPTGMRTPFDMASPWRSLMIYSSAWLTVSAVWTGFSRRKSLRNLLVVVAINAFVLALFGLVQRALGAEKIFWLRPSPGPSFVASFIYRNHAGAYFDLMLPVCCALAFWYHRRRTRRGERSSPAVVFGFFTLVVVMIVFYSFSRGAIILMSGFLALFAAGGIVRFLTAKDEDRSPLIIAFVSMLFVGFLGLGFASFKTGGLIDRLESLSKGTSDVSAHSRLLVAKATLEMVRDNPVRGWGAGGFQFYFPVYELRYPVISTWQGHRVFWEHAHNDYLELIAEEGAIGCGILAAGFVYYLVRLIRLRIWRHPAGVIVLGCFVTMAHASFDFPFFCPAVLITWCVLWPVMIRWVEIERLARRSPASLPAV